jgi:uncharacterized protein
MTGECTPSGPVPELIDHLVARLGSETLSRRLMLQREGATSVAHNPPWPIRVTRDFCRTRLGTALRHGRLMARFRRGSMLYELSETRMTLHRLPNDFESFRILHLSDLHIDSTPDAGRVLAELVRRIRCDLCVITGDFRDPELKAESEFRTRMGRLQEAVCAKYGTWAVLGNHDRVEDVPLLETLGITILLNEAKAIERNGSRIWIVGVDDPHFFATDDLERATQRTDKSELHLLLAHSPDLADAAASVGVDMYLCGHSHGGQICLPSGKPIVTNLRKRPDLASGRWRVGQMCGYTSRGIGTSGIPIRLNCRPELTVHVLGRDGGG